MPSGWARNVKSAVVHVISLGHHAIVSARGWAANSINARVRLAADNGQLKLEVQLYAETKPKYILNRDMRLSMTKERPG